MNDNELELYKLAIEARRTHYENFEKWMTFFYVAIGALLVAYYSSKEKPDISIFFSFIGFMTSTFWHLSCKGYKHWTDNWIRVIWHFEEQFQPNKAKRIYSLFSQKIIDGRKKRFLPWGSADISTPRVILLLSFVSCCSWSFLLIKNVNARCPKIFHFSTITVYLYLIFFALMLSYVTILVVMIFPLKNKMNESHTPFTLKRDEKK